MGPPGPGAGAAIRLGETAQKHDSERDTGGEDHIPEDQPSRGHTRPPSPVRRVYLRAIWPQMIAAIASGPNIKAMIPHTIDAMASGLVS